MRNQFLRVPGVRPHSGTCCAITIRMGSNEEKANDMTAACPLAFGETGVKERVRRVLSYKKPAWRLTALRAEACAVFTTIFQPSSLNTRTVSPCRRCAQLPHLRIILSSYGISADDIHVTTTISTLSSILGTLGDLRRISDYLGLPVTWGSGTLRMTGISFSSATRTPSGDST